MKNTLMKCAAAALVLCFLLPAGANAQKKKKVGN